MKFKVILIVLSLMFVAAACNKVATETPSPSPTPAPAPAPTPTPAPAPTPTPTPAPAQPKTVELVISATAFAPAQMTIKKGDTVKFVNNSGKTRWPASAPHPTHTDYPEFDPKQAIAAGSSWSFTFNKAGTWKYHDHLQPTIFGSITVTE